MLENIVKKNLVECSRVKFFGHVDGLDTTCAENVLSRVWNAYCGCRGNEQDELFDFSNEHDKDLWTRCCGDITYKECRFGMQIDNQERMEVTLRYLNLEELKRLVEASFLEIYQYVMVMPWCFDSLIVSLVQRPVIKEIGVVSPAIVGYDDTIVNNSML